MIKSINPYTGEFLNQYEELNDVQIREKISAGHHCYSHWKRSPMQERCELMKKVGKYLLAHKEELAVLMSREMGKPVSQAIAEIEKCGWLCDYYAEMAPEFLAPETVETDASKSHINYDPVGVILAVMPWNYPFWQVFRFAVPTLLAGNTCLLKHASNVMGCAEKIAEIFRNCGFPENAFQNLVIGSNKVAGVIQHQAVRGVSLTGSEPAGRAVASEAGKALKPSLLELGGSNASVVLEDADLEAAADIIVNARYQNTGQSCIAAKRLLIHKAIAEEFLKLIVDRVRSLPSGDPLDKGTYIGVVAREDLAKDLEDQMNRSLDKGARLLCGGKRKGAWFEPAVLWAESPEVPAMQEETFGPLLCVSAFRDLDEAIAVSNSTNYGLGVSIFTAYPEKVISRVAEFDEGAVFFNELVKSDPRLPFGGVKQSGYGRELGLEGIRAFVNVKTVYIK